MSFIANLRDLLYTGISRVTKRALDLRTSEYLFVEGRPKSIVDLLDREGAGEGGEE